MFDNYIYIEKSLRNVKTEEGIVGFEMETLMPYYRGIPLSLVRDFEVEVDGTVYEKSNFQFSVDGGEEFFTLDEMKTVCDIKWEYGTPGILRVLSPGGLPKGEHTVRLYVSVIVFYVPFPSAGTRTVRDVIAE